MRVYRITTYFRRYRNYIGRKYYIFVHILYTKLLYALCISVYKIYINTSIYCPYQYIYIYIDIYINIFILLYMDIIYEEKETYAILNIDTHIIYNFLSVIYSNYM